MVMKLTELNSFSFPYDITLGSVSFEILELSFKHSLVHFFWFDQIQPFSLIQYFVVPKGRFASRQNQF